MGRFSRRAIVKRKSIRLLPVFTPSGRGDCYIAADELAMFCRDLLPMVRESFDVIPEGFDEALYVPPKPEFELYLDRQAMDVVGAKLVAVYGDNKYNVLAKVEPGEVRDLSEELRIKSLVEPYFNEYDHSKTFLSLQKTKICSISSWQVACSG